MIFGSLVMRFANDFHSWLRHSWKSLANRLTRDPKIVIHGNSCIILYILCFSISRFCIPRQRQKYNVDVKGVNKGAQCLKLIIEFQDDICTRSWYLSSRRVFCESTHGCTKLSLIARLMWPTWCPSGPDVGPMSFAIWSVTLRGKEIHRLSIKQLSKLWSFIAYVQAITNDTRRICSSNTTYFDG